MVGLILWMLAYSMDHRPGAWQAPVEEPEQLAVTYPIDETDEGITAAMVGDLVERSYRTARFAEVAVAAHDRVISVDDKQVSSTWENKIDLKMVVAPDRIRAVAYGREGSPFRAFRLLNGKSWEYFAGETVESTSTFPSGVSLPQLVCQDDCLMSFGLISMIGIPTWEEFSALQKTQSEAWVGLGFWEMSQDEAEILYNKMDWAKVWSDSIRNGERELDACMGGEECFVIRTNMHTRYVSKVSGLILRWDTRFWADEDHTQDGGMRTFTFNFKRVESEIPTDVDWSIPTIPPAEMPIATTKE